MWKKEEKETVLELCQNYCSMPASVSQTLCLGIQRQELMFLRKGHHWSFESWMWQMLVQTGSFVRAPVWNRDGQMIKQMVALNQDSKFVAEGRESELCTLWYIHAHGYPCSWYIHEVYPCSWRGQLSMYTRASKFWGHRSAVPMLCRVGLCRLCLWDASQINIYTQVSDWTDPVAVSKQLDPNLVRVFPLT